jgi:hypothetical protein
MGDVDCIHLASVHWRILVQYRFYKTREVCRFANQLHTP